MWNYFTSPSFKANVGVRQGFTLSLILLALYIVSLFHIFEKKNLKSFNFYPGFYSFFCQWYFCFLGEELQKI